MDFKCIYFKQRLDNPLQCSSAQVTLKVLFFLRYQGRGCITALRPSVKCSIAVCQAECCTMYLTPWFKQYSRPNDLCLQWSGISCHVEWYQTFYPCQSLSCLSRTSHVQHLCWERSLFNKWYTSTCSHTYHRCARASIYDSAVFLSSYFSVLFSFCIMFFISALRTVVLNSVSALIDFCTVFTFSSESKGGLYRFFFPFFFAVCTNTLQAYFILSLSFFKCSLSVFCSLSCGINHICDVIALVLWTVDKLKTFMILPCMFSLWIPTNMYLYKYFRSIISLSKLQFKYSWRSSTVFYWYFYNKLLLSFRWVNTLRCLPKGSTKAFI